MELGQNDKTDHRKKLLPVSVIIVLLSLIFFAQRHSFSDSDFERVMSLAGKELNKKCPQMADEETRLDSCEILPGKTFQYDYTLLEMYRDSVEAEMLFVSFEPAMIRNAKTNPELELFRKNNVTFVYRFNDKLGNLITRITITPELYNR